MPIPLEQLLCTTMHNMGANVTKEQQVCHTLHGLYPRLGHTR